MSERLRQVAAAGLVIGATLGMAGSIAPSANLRGLLWGVDGIAIVVASALLVVHHGREGNDQLAAGFLVFLAGETLIVATSAMELTASAPLFGAGAGLWSGALALIRPLPYFAYPFLALTLLGWVWAHVRSDPSTASGR